MVLSDVIFAIFSGFVAWKWRHCVADFRSEGETGMCIVTLNNCIY